MSSNNTSDDISDSLLRTTHSQSNQQKEREARRDAEYHIRSFNYAKSIGRNADGKQEEGVAALSSLAQSNASNLSVNRDENCNNDGDDADALSTTLDVQARTADVLQNDSEGDIDVGAISHEECLDFASEEEVDNTDALTAESTNDGGNEFIDAIEKDDADTFAVDDHKKPLPMNTDDNTDNSIVESTSNMLPTGLGDGDSNEIINAAKEDKNGTSADEVYEDEETTNNVDWEINTGMIRIDASTDEASDSSALDYREVSSASKEGYDADKNDNSSEIMDDIEEENPGASAEAELAKEDHKDPSSSNEDDGERSLDMIFKDTSNATLESPDSDNREVSSDRDENDDENENIDVIKHERSGIFADGDSADEDRKDLPTKNEDDDDVARSQCMIYNETCTNKTALDSDNSVVSSDRDENGRDEGNMILAAVVGGAIVTSTTIAACSKASIQSHSDVCHSIPEDEPVSDDAPNETSNDNLSMTCIDGEEELSEDEDEDRTEYVGSVAGTIATGAVAYSTKELVDLSDHAVIDKESQVTNASLKPQDDHASLVIESPGSDSHRSQDEHDGQQSSRWKMFLILTAISVALVAVAGLGVGVDRGLNYVDGASILLIPLPTQSPTSEPSSSIAPSTSPSSLPSMEPSEVPSASPSITTMPSISPTVTSPPTLSSAPSFQPSQQPSVSTQPSVEPSSSPTMSAAPSSRPSHQPSISSKPSDVPSTSPSLSTIPSSTPTTAPSISQAPSNQPSTVPSLSTQPSSMPSLEIEPFRTMLKNASPRSAERLFRDRSYQYKVMMFVYYETDYDNYTDEERLQLWALGCFFEATLGVDWDNNTNWMTISQDITWCDWYGLTCDERRMVTRIELPQNHVQRNLPVEFKVLPNLQYLGLAENSIGRLDTMLFEIYTLEVIDLDGNGIETIPEQIPIRNQVKELYLAGNRIREIPESILMLSKLEVLWLWTNLLEDTLPEFMGRMSNLIELDLEDNFLSGDLWPAAQMQSLQYLYVFDNIMGGEITSGVLGGNVTYAAGDLESSPVLECSMLKSLDLSTNYWYGTIPTKFTNMVNMEELFLEDNELSGTIPTEIFGLSNLKSLYLGTNYLTSSIPSAIGNAQFLKSFRAENNYREMDNGRLISKGIYGELPTTLLNLKQLEELVLDNNYVEGTLFAELGTLEHLTKLRLVLNMLRGPIPSSIQKLSKLKDLQLWGNYMTGYLPNNLSLELERIQLHDNSFVGTIPTEWGRCSNLTVLDVSYNDLSGPVPSEFGNLVNLKQFYTEFNVLYGFMPEEVCSLRRESLDELSANCDVPRENTPPPTLRPTRRPTRWPTIRPTWREGWVRHHRSLQKDKPADLPITSAPSEYPTHDSSLWPSSPSYQATSAPTDTSSLLPSIQVEFEPTITANPSSSANFLETTSPTFGPSLLPSSQPTEHATSQNPSYLPSFAPTITLSQSPSSVPSVSIKPTMSPSLNPTLSHSPSLAPTATPSKSPTNSPTDSPTLSPSTDPTNNPTAAPTDEPSVSIAPSLAPTVEYYWVCSCCSYCRIDSEIHPTMKPTRKPTPRPTRSPSPTWDEKPTRPSSWWNKRVNELT